jgi:DNA-3-methyladenine glycosylase
MLNVVTGPADFPEAILIRGVEGFGGPGKLTKALGINKTLNGENLVKSDALWIEDNRRPVTWNALPRIGIGYASTEDQNRLWRFNITT